MRYFLFFLLILPLCARAELAYHFGFNTTESSSDIQKILYLSEERSSLSIRFGINDIVDLEIDSWPINLNCHQIQSDDLFQTVGSTLFLNSNLIKYHRNNLFQAKCQLPKRLGEALDKALLKLPFAIDLNLKASKSERKRYFECKRSIDEIQAGIQYLSDYDSRCDEVIDRQNRRDEFKKISKRFKSITYNFNLDIDLTSFGDNTLDRYNICDDLSRDTITTNSGNRIKMIGMSIVYMSPGFATSVLGHAGERYVFCYNNELIDKFFDYTKFNNSEISDLKQRYAGLPINENFISKLQSKLYIKERYNPATSSTYGEYQLKYNRDIIEVWLDVPDKIMFEALKQATNDYNIQGKQIVDPQKLPDYKLLENNCTHPIKSRLKLLGSKYVPNTIEGLTPKFIFNFLQNNNHKKSILYPSQRTLRLLNLAKEGRSLFFENFRSLSKASKNSNMPSNLIIYAETHSLINQLFLYPIAGITNTAKGIIDTSTGVVTGNKRDIQIGLRDVGLSLMEVFGLRTRYPSATEWTKEEDELVFDIIPELTPEVLNLL